MTILGDQPPARSSAPSAGMAFGRTLGSATHRAVGGALSGKFVLLRPSLYRQLYRRLPGQSFLGDADRPDPAHGADLSGAARRRAAAGAARAS